MWPCFPAPVSPHQPPRPAAASARGVQPGSRPASGRVRRWVSQGHCDVRVQALPVTVTVMVIPSKQQDMFPSAVAMPANFASKVTLKQNEQSQKEKKYEWQGVRRVNLPEGTSGATCRLCLGPQNGQGETSPLVLVGTLGSAAFTAACCVLRKMPE